MADIWEKYYPDRSFGLFKKEFFEHVTKVKGQNYRYSPRVKIEIRYKHEYDFVMHRVETVVNVFVDLFSVYKNREVKQFTLAEFEKELAENLEKNCIARQNVNFAGYFH